MHKLIIAMLIFVMHPSKIYEVIKVKLYLFFLKQAEKKTLLSDSVIWLLNVYFKEPIVILFSV